MALIAAVFGSFLGVIAGVIGTLFFGASLVVGFAIYVGVSMGMIMVFTATMLLRPHGVHANAALYEEALDEDYKRYSEQDMRPPSEAEQNFQDQLETPLSEGERRTGHDKDIA